MKTATYLIEEFDFMAGLINKRRQHFFKLSVQQDREISGADYHEGWAVLGTFDTEAEAKQHLATWLLSETAVSEIPESEYAA